MSTDAKRYISDLQSLEENPRGYIPKSYIFHPTCNLECPFDCDQDNWQIWENPKDKGIKRARSRNTRPGLVCTLNIFYAFIFQGSLMLRIFRDFVR